MNDEEKSNVGINSIASDSNQPTQLLLKCSINDGQIINFLADTGASYSCLPLCYQKCSLLETTNISVTSCTGSGMKVAGEINVEVGIPSLRRCYEANFLVCDVAMPILGMDFLKKYSMIIDCGNRTVTDPLTGISAKLSVTSVPSCWNLKFDIPIPSHLKSLFDQYHSVVRNSSNVQLTELPVKHYIDTGSAPPSAAKCRRLHGAKLEAARVELNRLQKLGIIRPSRSPYSSPIHMAPKSFEGYRLTGDYRSLNACTIPDRYPIPHLFSFQEKLRGMKVFSKIDLRHGFTHVRMNEKDIEKTAIITPFGLFEHLFMPQGLRNAPATFQRLMDQIMKPCQDFSFCFVDDIIIFSPDQETQRKQLFKVFAILEQYGMVINLSKCVSKLIR